MLTKEGEFCDNTFFDIEYRESKKSKKIKKIKLKNIKQKKIKKKKIKKIKWKKIKKIKKIKIKCKMSFHHKNTQYSMRRVTFNKSIAIRVFNSRDSVEQLNQVERIKCINNNNVSNTTYLDTNIKVKLTNIKYKQSELELTVLVRNTVIDKNVSIRLTHDWWKSFTEYKCSYSQSISSDYDVFRVSISVNEFIKQTKLVQVYFAVNYTTDSNEYWDNNNGMNYSLTFKLVSSKVVDKSREWSRPVSIRGVNTTMDSFNNVMNRHTLYTPPVFCTFLY